MVQAIRLLALQETLIEQRTDRLTQRQDLERDVVGFFFLAIMQLVRRRVDELHRNIPRMQPVCSQRRSRNFLPVESSGCRFDLQHHLIALFTILDSIHFLLFR